MAIMKFAGTNWTNIKKIGNFGAYAVQAHFPSSMPKS
jgi:hypothetical protein